jgi:hypothetical protein
LEIQKATALVGDYLSTKGFIFQSEQSKTPSSSAWLNSKTQVRCRFSMVDPNIGEGEMLPYTFVGTLMCASDSTYRRAVENQMVFADVLDTSLRADLEKDHALAVKIGTPTPVEEYFAIMGGAPIACVSDSDKQLINVGDVRGGGGFSYNLVRRDGVWHTTLAQCPVESAPTVQDYQNYQSIDGSNNPLKYDTLQEATAAFREKTDQSMIIDSIGSSVPGAISEKSGAPYTSYILGHYIQNDLQNICVRGYMNLLTGEAKSRTVECWVY